MSFIPLSNFSGNTNVSTSFIECYSRTIELPNTGMSNQEIRACVDYKMHKYGRFTKYVGVSKWNMKQGKNWATAELQQSGDYHVNTYGTAGTAFKIRTDGFGNGTIVGHLEVSWYIKYKGDRIINPES